ncbi:MAG: FtsX-like permease family protein [Mobilitalea sp.]
MLIRNSIKQLMRTPVKTILFLLLITFATILSTVGSNLWRMSSSNMRAFEAAFTTIGTVEQKKTLLNKVDLWDAITQTSSYHYRATYGDPIPLSVLDIEGADYIYEPEKRPFYGAYLPDYRILPPKTNPGLDAIIIEFTVDEDCVPDHKVEINLGKQIFARYQINVPKVWFCDRNNPNPEKLYAGKKYIMAMYETPYLNSDNSFGTVFTPVDMVGSMQYSKEGDLLPDDMRSVLYEEVTEGFYETEHGIRWLEVAESMEMPYHTVPVTSTNSTNLLMPFYSGTAYVKNGKDISKEEYDNGDKVCLISSKFAKTNNLEEGDKITLPLYYANYQFSAGRAYGQGEMWSGFNLLNANGKAYPVFYEAEYTIVGVFISVGGGNYSGYTMADNEIVIPTKSMEASDKENIVAYGPMMGYTTTFQIPNGSIEEYNEKFLKLGLEDLEITFYDKGYTQLKAGLDKIKSMSSILLAAGMIATVLILVFFCNMFIAKQKKRTAIERSLGMSKWKCTYSMISGILLIVLIGSLIGCLIGFFLADKTTSVLSGQSYYDTTYTNGSVSNIAGEETQMEYARPIIALSLGTCGIIVLLAILISFLVVSTNLRCEPLELLSEKLE